jgi:tetratricopeptide (TPR) repeat protein
MHIFRLSLLLCFCALFACTRSPEDRQTAGKAQFASATSFESPKLLDRNEALHNGKEWDDVQNFYAAQLAALRANPQDAEARIRLAEVFIQEARVTGEHPHYYPAALEVLTPVIANLSGKPDLNPREKDHLFRALSHKAGVQLSLHDFAAALETAAKAVEINPYNAQIYGALVDANVELGRYAKAVEMADKMVGIRPDLRSYSRVSYLRELHGDVPGAIEAMDMAVKAGYPGQEQTAWARLTLGNLFQGSGDWKKAEEQYKLVLNERPDYPFALAALAEVEMHRKNYTKAGELLKKACSIIPEVGFYEKTAELLRLTGQTEAARALVPDILKMMEEDMEKGHNMNLELAALYTELQPDYEKALQYALKEYEKRPDNIDVNRRLALIYAAQKDMEQARNHALKASATNSKHPELAMLKKMLRI